MTERICSRRDIPLRERLLWRMLYDAASRRRSRARLHVEDCDLENRRARVTIKGSDTAWIVRVPRHRPAAAPLPAGSRCTSYATSQPPTSAGKAPTPP